ncbi:terminase family protein [Bacteroides sp.]|uniref:phage terminase large subunit family protein n=1 Tax=Bacteroides sp. TaxID=29523 RepID=UPI0026350B99|nr:terminase family protein [Bacteroides sp.]MDD3039557.1 terminase family protein [Bacteroides sp.]
MAKRKQVTVGDLRSDPVLFAEHVLGITLHEGQKRILRSQARFIAVRAARRFGKSYVFSAYAAWAICTQENYRVIVISRIMRQSLEMFKTIKAIIMNSPMAESVVRCTMTEIVLSNGSQVQSLPGSSPNTLRGITANLVMVDEAAYVDEEIFIEIYPTILSTKGRMILISTPAFEVGEFYRACMLAKEYTSFHFTHADAVWDDGTPFVDPDELEREIDRCGGRESPEYRREYLAEFGNADGVFFDVQALRDAMRADDGSEAIYFAEEGHKYVTGVDIGQINDYTVIATMDITDPNAYWVREIQRFKGESVDAIIIKINDAAARFNSQKVLIDEGNIGRSIIEHLKIRFPHRPFVGFNFNVSTKPRVMMNLNILLNRRQLFLPDDIELQKEMMSFKYSTNARTKSISMGGANGVHDDIPIALALCVEAAEVFVPRGTLGLGLSGGRMLFPGAPARVSQNEKQMRKRRNVLI